MVVIETILANSCKISIQKGIRLKVLMDQQDLQIIHESIMHAK